ncbi:MAG: hypothetical protein ACP5SH_26435 [Syntrophobacteraceae bacterium]
MKEADASVFKPLFPAEHVPVILFSLLKATTELRKKTDDEREDRLTSRLYRSIVMMPKFRDGPLDIRLQPEIPSTDPQKDTPGGRIDLLVSCGKGNEVYFAIEAKRLRVCSTGSRVTHHGSTEYVTQGMMRFVSGQYAPYMRAGAMLGYVFDGRIEKARSGINRSIRNRAKKLKMKTPDGLTESTIMVGKPIDETTHHLAERRFIIYHLLVAV